MIRQKAYFVLENLDQSNDLNMGFVLPSSDFE